MPLTFVYLIGLVMVGLLAFFAPHARGLCMTMAEIYSVCMIIAGLFEASRNQRLD